MEEKNYSFYHVDVNVSDSEIIRLRTEWNTYIRDYHQYLGQDIGKGRGIVITAGGIKYFTSAWILINSLRSLGCTLSIELWHYGDEITGEMESQLSILDVNCRDLKPFVENVPHGFLMKPLSIIYSSFCEVLYLDADNICIKDPTYLFHDKNYREFGCLFWPDFWVTSKSNPIWGILEIEYFEGCEQESGQILINKGVSWPQLQLCLFLNINNGEYSRFLYGDKDTFRFAWLATGKEYYMIERDVGSCGYLDSSSNFCGTTMVQHDPDGEILFLHRNLLKWDVTLEDERVWERIKIFKKDALKKKCVFNVVEGGHKIIDLIGDTEEFNFRQLFPYFESECLVFLKKLRASEFYKKELQNAYILANRFS